tara:strand:- start:1849 stop:2205 length:357 start_codon:yes stop_codon:yes gene_type:complete
MKNEKKENNYFVQYEDVPIEVQIQNVVEEQLKCMVMGMTEHQSGLFIELKNRMISDMETIWINYLKNMNHTQIGELSYPNDKSPIDYFFLLKNEFNLLNSENPDSKDNLEYFMERGEV